jgi:hypothetical protein
MDNRIAELEFRLAYFEAALNRARADLLKQGIRHGKLQDENSLLKMKLRWRQGRPRLGWCWIRHGHKGNGRPYITEITKYSDEYIGNCSMDELYWAGPIPRPSEGK